MEERLLLNARPSPQARAPAVRPQVARLPGMPSIPVSGRPVGTLRRLWPEIPHRRRHPSAARRPSLLSHPPPLDVASTLNFLQETCVTLRATKVTWSLLGYLQIM